MFPNSQDNYDKHPSLYVSKPKMKRKISDSLNFDGAYSHGDSKFEGNKNNIILDQIQILNNYLNKPRELRRSPIRPFVNFVSNEPQVNYKDNLSKSPTNKNSFKQLIYSYDFQYRSIDNSSADIKNLKYIIERQKIREKFNVERFDDEMNFCTRHLFNNSLKRSDWKGK